MNMKIRLSPSGPIIGEAGVGFILAQAFGNADIDPTYETVANGDPVELKEDPGTPAAAPFVRPELTAVELDKEYTVEANIAAVKSDSWATAVANVFIDYSTDSGASWNTLTQTTFAIPGIVGLNNGSAIQFEVETDPLPGTSIPGLVEGGTLMVRARWGQVGGVSNSFGFNGTSTGVAAGGFNLKVTKQLAAT